MPTEQITKELVIEEMKIEASNINRRKNEQLIKMLNRQFVDFVMTESTFLLFSLNIYFVSICADLITLSRECVKLLLGWSMWSQEGIMNLDDIEQHQQ